MSLLFRAFQLSFGLFSKPAQQYSYRDQSLTQIWRELHSLYFPEHEILTQYRIAWSPRKHRRTLASCNVDKRKISVAPVMNLPEAQPFLEALIFHEMCHAVLGTPKRVNGRRQIHGKDFKLLENLHAGIPALDAWILGGGWRTAAKKYNRARRHSAALSGIPYKENAHSFQRAERRRDTLKRRRKEVAS